MRNVMEAEVMRTRYLSIVKWAAAAALVGGLLAGCGGRDSDLDRFIDATKKEPGGRVEPLPR